MQRKFFLMFPLLMLLTGCNPPKSENALPPKTDAPTPSAAPALQVAAAADLTKAFTEIGAAYKKQNGQKVIFIFGASGQLRDQIAQAAPYDVFAAANEEYIDRLAGQHRMIPETKQVYAIGQLTLWTPKSVQPAPKSLQDLTAPRFRHIALASPEHAPYGKAAKNALTKAGLWDTLQSKIVYGQNVQQAFQFAQTGNADAALTSHALTGGADGAQIPVPQDLYQPLRQAIAVTTASKQPDAAKKFIAFVQSAAGRDILTKYGFALP